MQITIKINKARVEDSVLNPLNNILLLSHESKVHKKIDKNVQRIISALERESIIGKRKTTCKTNPFHRILNFINYLLWRC